MSIFVVICFALAAVLATIAAAYSPPAPSRYNLLAAALAFLSLGFFLQSLSGVTG